MLRKDWRKRHAQKREKDDRPCAGVAAGSGRRRLHTAKERKRRHSLPCDRRKSDLYLLGSIHVGSEDMYPMGQHILDAMEAADVLAFECDTASAQAQAAYQELMRCPEGDTLEAG